MRRAKERSRQNFAVVLGFVERAVRSLPDQKKREREDVADERERERTKRDHIISGLLSQKHIIIIVVVEQHQHQQQRERENKKNTNEENLVRGGAPS